LHRKPFPSLGFEAFNGQRHADAKFPVECGIDSISLNPDTLLKTTAAILEQEVKQSAAAGGS
jgi:hypothetical protein